MPTGFYAAVDCVIRGRNDDLRAMLDAEPALASARSPRDHRATLLHYVAANGVEDELQITPPNAVEIAATLLAAGAEVDATCEIYGGGLDSTPMIALVTSVHPHKARVQSDLVELFCTTGGARVDGLADDGAPISMAVSFFYPLAAAALARGGARVDNAIVAAGLGMTETMIAFLDAVEVARHCAPFDGLFDPAESEVAALAYAALGGHVATMAVLVDRGVPVNASTRRNIHRAEVIALHMAAAGGHLAAVEFLLEREADVGRRDGRWGATPGAWADYGGHATIADRLGHLRGKTAS